MNGITINLFDVLECLTRAEDIVSPKLVNHHQQVAYLSFRIGQNMNLSPQQQKNMFIAALIHDIGALSVQEKLELVEDEPVHINSHGFRGAKLLEGFRPLQEAAKIIKFHHQKYDGGKGLKYGDETVPIESHIIHLADRVCTKFNFRHDILSQVPRIIEDIEKQVDSYFAPEIFEAFAALAKLEFVWFDLGSKAPMDKLPKSSMLDYHALGVDDFADLARIFSHIIDFRSRFTASHSAGVAKSAECLARLMGFSPEECKRMLIAGYLHDLGKLIIDEKILEKPGKLNEYEYNLMRIHTYYTYHLLNTIPQIGDIKEWAAYHHEKLNGNGYPFHIKGENLPLGSRIMAVADIFTAIVEDRPYRKGMTDAEAIAVLTSGVQRGELDGKVVSVLVDNFTQVREQCMLEQSQAIQRYQRFMEI